MTPPIGNAQSVASITYDLMPFLWTTAYNTMTCLMHVRLTTLTVIIRNFRQVRKPASFCWRNPDVYKINLTPRCAVISAYACLTPWFILRDKLTLNGRTFHGRSHLCY